MKQTTKLLLSSLIVTASTAALAKNEWTNFMGNPAHTGYLAQTTNPSNFRALWSVPVKETDMFDLKIHPVISDNTLYYTLIEDNRKGPYPFQSSLIAINLDDGKQKWNTPADSRVFLFSDPIISNDSVTLNMHHLNGFDIDYSQLAKFDIANGKLANKPVHLANRKPGAPAGYGDTVYILGDEFKLERDEVSNLESIAASGKSNWVTPASGTAQMMTFSEKYIISPSDEPGLDVYNRVTGAKEFTLKWQHGQTATSNRYLPTIDEQNDIVYYFNSPNIFAFDLKTQSLKWTQPIGYANDMGEGNILTVNGEVYVVARQGGRPTPEGDSLVSLDRETGEIKWSWRPESPEKLDAGNFYLVATTDTIFVTGDKFTYAISPTTHKSVWKANKVGELALGNNRLVISNNRSITAYALN